MKSLALFGKNIKLAHPEYADMPDEEVGQLVSAKYPNSFTEYLNQGVTSNLQRLFDEYDPKKGVFRSWLKRRKSVSKGKLLEALNNEERLFLEQAAMYEKAVLEGERTKAEYQLFLAQSRLVIEAVAQGMTVETMQEGKLSEMRVEEHRQKSQIDLDNKLTEMRETMRLALLSSVMSDHQKVIFTQELIDSIYKQIHDIELLPISQALKLRMKADREEIIETLKDDRRAKQSRLLQTNNGQDI